MALWRDGKLLALTIVCFVVCLSIPAWADIYSYRDQNGITHFTKDPNGDSRYKLLYRIPATAKRDSPAN